MSSVNSFPSSTNLTFGQKVPKQPKSFSYRCANTFFNAPEAVDRWTKRNVTSQTGSLSKVRNGFVKFVGGLGKQLTDYDFREFPELAIGKYRVPLSGPPMGALLLLLYPGTVIPRLYRAYERGKPNHDYREMWDVLRRDMTAITLFVFALGPVVKGLSMLTQKLGKVQLLDPETKSVLKYSQLRNYEIHNASTLKAILMEGNGTALKNAVQGLHDRGLERKFGFGKGLPNKLTPAIEDIKSKVNELVEAFDTHNKSRVGGAQPGWSDHLQKLSEKANQAFHHAEQLREDVALAAKKGGSAELAKETEKMKGEFTGVLTKYAQVRRLPADVISFAILVGAIGYLPMWINTEWNKRQFERKMAAKIAAERAAEKARHKMDHTAPPPAYHEAIKTPTTCPSSYPPAYPKTDRWSRTQPQAAPLA